MDVKPDASPVTAADRAAEAAMRALVQRKAPAHAVFGEEGGLTRGAAGGGEPFVWVLDPIDGTKSFITGKPLFGTLIALVDTATGTPLLGVLDQPVLRERWLGVAGRPTTLNGEAVRVRACAQLRDAYMYSTTPFMFDAATRPPYDDLAAAVRMPMYGCDCYAYGLLALGLCDVVAEADLKPYDYMALVPIVTGAGGIMTDWRVRLAAGHCASQRRSRALTRTTPPQGKALMWRPGDAGDRPGEVLAAGDVAAHKAALEVLQRKFR